MKQLINKVENIVEEQISGMALAHPELQYNAHPRYLIGPSSSEKVALISGGGSGHEPLHIGFIGQGMLTAACPGEIFTSPTPDQMYECAKAVNNQAGILFLIKNYTGDVLNFETAVELLHSDGIAVGSVLIDDDVAVKDSIYTAGRRGVAATVLVEKIVGAAAQRGYSLTQCEILARRVNNAARSFGVALSACTVPAAGKPSFILEDDIVEFGVGIHGEPGIERKAYTDLDSLIEQMFAEIKDCPEYTRILQQWDRETGQWLKNPVTIEPFVANEQYIVLVNGFGGTPESQLYGAYAKLTECCAQANFKIARQLVGNYCTALNMQGLSITLLKADAEILALWDDPVNTPALRWGC
ncbi:MAG: dihydroxyacetone kinase-like protein [Psychromonas sp.]|uniref:dihydroxyacetone kinase subunit DhaK n=1 Tax=Psychromonas sp. TaxID=1884585 RepID=UPI0039E64939